MIKGVINFEEMTTIDYNKGEYYVETYEADDLNRDLHNYIKGKLISRIGSSKKFKEN